MRMRRRKRKMSNPILETHVVDGICIRGIFCWVGLQDNGKCWIEI